MIVSILKNWAWFAQVDYSHRDDFDRIIKITPNEHGILMKWGKIENYIVIERELSKGEQIVNIVSISDQLNLLATCIEVLSEWNTDPRIEYARGKFNEVKNILKQK